MFFCFQFKLFILTLTSYIILAFFLESLPLYSAGPLKFPISITLYLFKAFTFVKQLRLPLFQYSIELQDQSQVTI